MIRAVVVGATGYTGAELVRLILGHPGIELHALVGHSRAGEPVSSVLPSLAGIVPGEVAPFEPASFAGAQAAFCALPHGASADKVAALRAAGLVVFDLSADFRLRSLDAYREWYGEHPAPERLEEAVYGLPELHRDELRRADLVAVPGCYPTATILPIAPLLRADLLELDGGPIVVDAKSGVSGAGRVAKPRSHFPETAESVRAYSIAGRHRHTPEIEQELSQLARRDVRVIFAPHLVPMTRGMLSTIYLRPRHGVTAERCTELARELYAGSPSVHVLAAGESPDTLWVRGSNRAHVSYTSDARSGWIVAQGALDNLIKGAAGQAIQCLNVRFGLDEGLGLTQPALWP